ncbi:hypothetical protein JTE90_013553 [Oedothorax gibbosus]|uniref:THAP-type domain-containing protein n=1 Tax=Oedothorax gibbosus TaxID=931172 RepID=A0AAV6UEE3_9ARAC|nr:hypothetical protein JTE90_013553 [Oedothorax gibbosus]
MKEWLVRIQRRDFFPVKGTKICSDHFEPSSFCNQKGTKRLLVKGAIPTIFAYDQPGFKRKRSSVGDDNFYDPSEECSVEKALVPQVTLSISSEAQTDVPLESFVNELFLKKCRIDKLKPRDESILDPEKMSEAHVRALFGMRKEEFFKVFRFLNFTDELNSETLSIIQQYTLFLLRLKSGITLDFLAYLFEISAETACKTFDKVVDVVYKKLQGVSIWPTKEQILEIMPSDFKVICPECRIIIDCVKFYISKPTKRVEKHLAALSQYKDHNILKALVGIAPSGRIIYISHLWGDSISDEEIFKGSVLPQLLEKGDVVIADGEFKIEDELKEIGVGLIRPVFLKDGIQFRTLEGTEKKGVSSLRVHIERAISRIKKFKYFDDALSYSPLHNLNEAFYITAFLSNFNASLKDVMVLEELENASIV